MQARGGYQRPLARCQTTPNDADPTRSESSRLTVRRASASGAHVRRGRDWCRERIRARFLLWFWLRRLPQHPLPQARLSLRLILWRRVDPTRREYLQLVGLEVAPDAQATLRRLDGSPGCALVVAAHAVIAGTVDGGYQDT